MKKNTIKKIESPAFMYIISVVMFILLSFTIVTYLKDVMTPNVNDKIERSEEINKSENIMANSKANYSEQQKARRRIRIARTNHYKNEYKNYEKEMQYRQKLLRLQKENEELKLKQKQNEKLAQIEHKIQQLKQEENENSRNIPEKISKQETYQPKNENPILNKAMEKSLCDKNSATAIIYFFHPNNSEPIELIFNNPQSNKQQTVKMIFGDLPRTKRHILKNNYSDLASLINKPKYSTSNSKPARNDVIMKVSAGVTTSCSPYVYKSEDFYVSNIPVTKQNFAQRENYCKSQNTRLADSLELISLVMTGRFPAGYYWTTSKSYRLNPNATSVRRNVLTPANEFLLLDYDHSSIGFVTQTALARISNTTVKSIQAYSVCVIDE